jgi:acyl-CoA thioesterase-1
MYFLYHKQRSLFETVKCLKFCYFLLFVLVVSCADQNKSQNEGVKSSESSKTAADQGQKEKIILCFGDSITAGYGLEDNSEAYPGVLQAKIDSLNWNFEVINSGLSGETTSGGLSRINWILNQQIDYFILELGANDGLRGIPLDETRSNLKKIIETVQSKDDRITIILAGMELPPNMGEEYITEFRTIFSELARNVRPPIHSVYFKQCWWCARTQSGRWHSSHSGGT